MQMKPKVLSLYSGAGGFDLGFRRAGFKLVWANDLDASACATYRANLGDHIVEGDLEDVSLPRDEVDVVIGGPPCQGWSRMGRMDPDDPRSKHVYRFFDVVERVEPRGFVLENVAHLAESPRWEPVRDELTKRAQRLGFSTKICVLDASEFCVPQARRRMFLVGLRHGTFERPRTTSKIRPRTVRQALSRLPDLGAKGNGTPCAAAIVPAKRPVLRASAHQGSLLFNGSGRPLDLDRPARTLTASMGGNATPILDPRELAGVPESWIEVYHRDLIEGRPPSKEMPDTLRRISVEEAAALQSFPKTYDFRGSTNAKFRQIGNAVPPLLAGAVARAMMRALVDVRSSV